jgi:hypothetical protein
MGDCDLPSSLKWFNTATRKTLSIVHRKLKHGWYDRGAIRLERLAAAAFERAGQIAALLVTVVLAGCSGHVRRPIL